MLIQNNNPSYKRPPIGSIETLAKVLSIKPDGLISLALHANAMYRVAKEIKKDNGDIRITYDAKGKLKVIQKRIKSRILDQVSYPRYLQGGISDSDFPRDYLRDAQIHTNSRTVITNDILKFFPSVSRFHIRSIWQNLFNFPPIVADCLTSLTIKDNELPQGVCTSSHLANLVFWNLEPQIVLKFKEKNMTYTRFVDDINVSTNDILSAKKKSFVISSINGMLSKKGLSPNRKKIVLSTNGFTAKGKKARIHNLNIGKPKVALSKDERNSIRAAVKECEIAKFNNVDDEVFSNLMKSAYGRVRRYRKLHSMSGTKLLNRLDAING